MEQNTCQSEYHKNNLKYIRLKSSSQFSYGRVRNTMVVYMTLKPPTEPRNWAPLLKPCTPCGDLGPPFEALACIQLSSMQELNCNYLDLLNGVFADICEIDYDIYTRCVTFGPLTEKTNLLTDRVNILFDVCC